MGGSDQARPQLGTPERLRAQVRSVLRDPVAWTDVLQVVKTAAAAVAAWVVAARVLDLPQPFLAPWSALLVVHATVYRSFWTGAKQIVATFLGVILAGVTGTLVGLGPAALGAMVLAGLLVGQVRWLREESTTAAATALIVLTAGYSTEGSLLLGRLVDTSVGIVVGVLVNVLVWPPFRDLAAARAVESVGRKVGALLGRIAEDLHGKCCDQDAEAWVRRSEELDEEVDGAWALVRQARESGRLNPRPASATIREPGEFGEILERAEQALSDVRSMARTLAHSISDTHEWDDEFRERWVALLEETGWAIQHPDARRLGEIRTKLQGLASDYSDEELSARHWPEYGGLILNLRNIATSMDAVADSDPVSSSLRGPMRSAL
jgi:cell shape-determining protein MreD